MQATTERANIRGVDQGVWREIRAEAIRQGVPIGSLVTRIFRDWLTEHSIKSATR